MLNTDQLSELAEKNLLDIRNVWLCYKNFKDEEEYSSIADVLEFGAPTSLDEEGGEELELMNDHLYVFSEELKQFVILQ